MRRASSCLLLLWGAIDVAVAPKPQSPGAWRHNRPPMAMAGVYPLVGELNYTEAQIMQLWETKVRVTDKYLAQYEQPGNVYKRLLSADPNLRLAEPHRTLVFQRMFTWSTKSKIISFEELLHGDHDYPRVPIVLDFIAWTRKYGLERPESMLATFPDDFEMPYIAPTPHFFDAPQFITPDGRDLELECRFKNMRSHYVHDSAQSY